MGTLCQQPAKEQSGGGLGEEGKDTGIEKGIPWLRGGVASVRILKLSCLLSGLCLLFYVDDELK